MTQKKIESKDERKLAVNVHKKAMICGLFAIIVLLILALIFLIVQLRVLTDSNSQFDFVETTSVVLLPKEATEVATTCPPVSHIENCWLTDAQRRSRADELAFVAASLQNTNLDLSLLLGIEAFNTWDDFQTRNILLDNIQVNPQLIKHLHGIPGRVTRVAFSPGGKTLASGYDNGTVVLWDAADGKSIGQLITGYGWIENLIFSPDGKTILFSSDNGTIFLWNLADGKLTNQQLTSSGKIESAAFSTDGMTIASGTAGGTIVLWNVPMNKRVGQLQGHSGGVASLSFSPDGRTLASGNDDGTIILWNLVDGEPIGQPIMSHESVGPTGIRKFEGEGSWPAAIVIFSPDGKILASESQGSPILLWNVADSLPIGRPLSGSISYPSSMAFSPDSSILAIVDNDGAIVLWNVLDGEPIGRPLESNGRVDSIAFSPDGSTIASGNDDGTITLWDVAVHEPTYPPVGQQFSGCVNFCPMAFSPDGKILAYPGGDGTIVQWDMTTKGPNGQAFSVDPSIDITSMAFSPDGRTFALGGLDGSITLWDVSTGKRVWNASMVDGPVGAIFIHVENVAYSPDGKTLASENEYDILMLDVATGKPIGHRLIPQLTKEPFPSLFSMGFSPDGKTLAAGSSDGNIFLWDITTQKPSALLFTDSSPVESVAFNPDGRTFASGNDDGTIILWDLGTRKPIGQPLLGYITGVPSGLTSLAFSPDGRILASGNDDGTILLWDLTAGVRLSQPLNVNGGGTSSIVFSPDGRVLVSGTHHNTFVLWELAPEFWVKLACQRAGRNITRSEWMQYFPGENYRATCPQWPVEMDISPASNNGLLQSSHR
jgi:WD40 repeat protein